jgi:putative spermidine/putrescine transport system permease protein
MTPARWTRVSLGIYCAGVLAFLILPLLIVVPVSFSSAAYLQFPPPGLSTRWYHSYFSDPTWIAATLLSVRVAAGAALVAVVAGTAAAYAVVRTAVPGKTLLRLSMLTPLIVPTIITAIAVYNLYISIHLVGTFRGLVLAHAVLATPFTFVLMAGAFGQVDRRLEEAARTMGASPFRTFRTVTLPLVLPGLIGAAVFAFITSWDEVVVALFVAGVTATTLPLKMFSYLQTEINPTIAAVSTMLILVVCLILVLGPVVRRRLMGALLHRVRGARGVS